METVLIIIGKICCGWFIFAAFIGLIGAISTGIAHRKAQQAWFNQGRQERDALGDIPEPFVHDGEEILW